MGPHLECYNATLEMKTDFAALDLVRKAAHDIRSPLSALNMLTQQSDWNRSEVRNLLMIAINRINDISNDLLKQNETSLEHTNVEKYFEINKVALDIINEKRLQFPSPQVQLFFLPSMDPKMIAGNQSLLQRALSNFINNSVEAKKSEKVKIVVSVENRAEKVLVKISDDGKGMSEATLKRLGNESFSEGDSKTLTGSGHGLGVKGSVEMLKKLEAEIIFESKLDQGTTISIELNAIK